MSMMLLFMHHIALCTSCIALFNCGHLCIYARSRGAEIRISSGANPMGVQRSISVKLRVFNCGHLCIYARSRGAEIKISSGASPMGVQRSISVKLRGC
jgi:hypothetical protein